MALDIAGAATTRYAPLGRAAAEANGWRIDHLDGGALEDYGATVSRAMGRGRDVPPPPAPPVAQPARPAPRVAAAPMPAAWEALLAPPPPSAWSAGGAEP